MLIFQHGDFIYLNGFKQTFATSGFDGVLTSEPSGEWDTRASSPLDVRRDIKDCRPVPQTMDQPEQCLEIWET